MCTATTGVIFKLAVGIVVDGAEGQVGQPFGNRRITVTAVTGTGGFEGAPLGIVAVTVKAAAGGMGGFGHTGKVVFGLGVADLTETTVGISVNEPVGSVGVGNGERSCCCVHTLLDTGPDHGEVAAAVGIMTTLAEEIRILAGASDTHVSAHVLEPGDGLAAVMAGSALTVVIGEGQADIIAKNTRNVCRGRVVATVAAGCAGKGCLSMPFGGAQSHIRCGYPLNL